MEKLKALNLLFGRKKLLRPLGEVYLFCAQTFCFIKIEAIDGSRRQLVMLNMSLPWWEFIARAAIIYFFLLITLRLTGRRQVGQLSPFDFVMLLILSNAVQNSMNGGDNSVLGGVILATTLIGINWLLAFLTYKSQ